MKIPKDLKSLQLIKVLKREGFKMEHSRGSHCQLKHPDGRQTTIPLHNKPLRIGTLLSILHDVKISKEELLKLL